MNLAIIGTRGIPNHYGGFEQLAQYLSVMLVKRGHQVTVYCSSLHPLKHKHYEGVKLVYCYDPENYIGSAGQFVYDLNCIWHSRSQSFDIILQLGYTSSSVWSWLFPKKAKIVTNMDGLEWKRSKYGKWTRLFLLQAEKWAARNSHLLIADSTGIQQYLKASLNVDSIYIPYGADLVTQAEASLIQPYNVSSGAFFLVIARLEPENNIECIIKGYLLSGRTETLVIIGSTRTTFGKYLKQNYASEQVVFKESVFDITHLNALRANCLLYFHGHSVGGTNPSLLEAMASGAPICAHNNVFNRSILEEDACYFSEEKEVAFFLKNLPVPEERRVWVQNNLTKIKTLYSWEKCCLAYEKAFIEACRR